MKYFLSLASVADSEKEVTKEQYIEAEQAAGFRSKFGDGEIATAGFSNGAMRGRVDYEIKARI